MVSGFKKRLLISFSIILGSALFAGIILYYIAGITASMAAKIVTDRAFVSNQTGFFAVLASLKQQAPEAANYQVAIEKLLPTQDGLIDFTQWVTGIAAQDQVVAGVAFAGSGNSGGQVPGVAFGEEGFSLTVTGAPDDIIAFLADIESKSSGFLISLNSFTLTKVNNNYQLQSRGAVFFRQ